MAAGATGATTGKGSVAGAARGNGGALALLAGPGHAAASGEATQGVQPARQPQPAGPHRDNTHEAVGQSTDAAAGVRAQGRAQGVRARGGAGRNGTHPAGFAQALDRLRTTPVAPAATAAAGDAAQAADPSQRDVPADVAASASEPPASQEDATDASPAGDAASAALAAVLQWLRPVVPVNGGGAQGGSPQGEEQGTDPAIAGVGAAGAAAAATNEVPVAVVGSDRGVVDGPAAPAPAVATALPPGLAVAATAADATDAMQSGANAAGPGGQARPATGSGTRASGVASTPAGAADASTIDQGIEALASAIRKVVALDDAGSGQAPVGRDGNPPAADGTTPVATAVGKPGSAPDATAGFAAAVGAAQRGSATAGPERTVPVPVHDRHWPQAMAGQVLVLADQRIDSATLRLSPGHLGPVEVHIDLQSAGINVSFGAEHAETRTALEQALPQLRAAFAGAGLTLGQATVQQQLRQGSQNAQATAQDRGSAADHVEVTPAVIRAIGLVDEYV
jgi:flagellar hook-length control protein FliK